MPGKVEECDIVLSEPGSQIKQPVNQRPAVEIFTIEHLEAQPFERYLDSTGVIDGVGKLSVRGKILVAVVADDERDPAAEIVGSPDR